ncbi:protein transporter tim10 [Pestalotiopsis sp. IQ-011]
MDYGYLNDNPPIALHDLEEESVAKAIQNFPKGYNPFPQHYEETERNGNDHFVQTSDPGSINNEVHPCFGALGHTNPRNGLYYFRHLQGLEFGLRRPEDGGLYESAKFNQRLNPRVDRVGNYNLERTDQKRTDADMIAGSLVHFPNVGGLVTSGLYKASGVPFKETEAVQGSAFFERFWNFHDLRDLLMEELFGEAETLSNFTRTCQKIRSDVDYSIEHFDTNALDFQLCDKTPQDLARMVKEGKITQKQADGVRMPKFLVIGPIRKPLKMAPGFQGDAKAFYPPEVQNNKDLFNKVGFRTVNPYMRKQMDGIFQRQCGAVQKTLVTMFKFQWNVRFLTLTQMHFLDFKTLEAIVESLPHLKCLNIYSCELLDLSEVRNVIMLVGRINKDRQTNKKSRWGGRYRYLLNEFRDRALLDLDIAPQYRQGHATERMGTYGITHNDPQMFQDWNTDIGCALAAQLVSIVRESRRAGIDILQPGKAFRRWLDRLPLDINQTFNLCLAATHYVHNQVWREILIPQVFPSERGLAARKAMMERLDDTVSIDLTVAATARPLSQRDFEAYGTMKCTRCDEVLPGVLFSSVSRARAPQHRICEGCDLNSQLNNKIANFHMEKIRVGHALWRDIPAGVNRLEWIIGSSEQAAMNHGRFLQLAGRLLTPEQCLAKTVALEAERQDIYKQMARIFDWRVKKPLDNRAKAIVAQIENWRIRAGYQRKPHTGRETEYDWEYRRSVYAWRKQLEHGQFSIENAPYQNVTMTTLMKAFHMRH